MALPLRRHPVHEGGVHPGHPLQGGGLRRDVGYLSGGAPGLRLRDEVVVVERVEEVAERIGRGEAAPQEAAEAPIRLEYANVVEAIAPGGEQQNQGLDLLRLGVAALALADLHVLGDRLVQAERAHRLQDQR